MAKRKIDNINGVKIIKRYSFANIFTSILSILLFLLPLFQVFIQAFSIRASDPIDVHAINWIMGSVGVFQKHFIPELVPIENDFSNYFYGIVTSFDNEILRNVVAFLPLLFFAFFTIEVVFAVIAFIIFLRILITGHLSHYALPKNAGIWMFIMQFLVSLFAYLLAFLDNYTMNEPILINNLIWPFVYLGISFIVMLALLITYLVSFKNAVYVKRVNQFIEEQEQIKNRLNNFYGYVGSFQSPNPEQSRIISQQQMQQPIQQTPQIEKVYMPATNPKGLPVDLREIRDQAFNANLDLQVAIIPDGIKTIGSSSFANCINLKVVSIPSSVTTIGYNAFFNCYNLKRINYSGTKEGWKQIKRGSNWLVKAGTTSVVCKDGAVIVNPYH